MSPEAHRSLELLQPRFGGQTALIFGTGPSLPELWAGRYSDLPKIAINDAWKVVADADILYACDQRWWVYHGEALDRARAGGIRIGFEVEGLPGVVSLRGSGASGYDARLGYMRHNTNSGCQAVHLAAQLGAVRIVLVGFDMRGGHFFGDHPKKIAVQNHYDLFISRFDQLGRNLAQRGVAIVNATPGSAMTCFPMVRLGEELARTTLAVAS